jgi:hypothetical protein
MSKMIQVRNVPDRLHRELVNRAKRAGQPLTVYIQTLLEREIRRPPAAEVFERLARRPKVDLELPAAELLREERSTRESR